jgi:hypothetical protein
MVKVEMYNNKKVSLTFPSFSEEEGISKAIVLK